MLRKVCASTSFTWVMIISRKKQFKHPFSKGGVFWSVFEANHSNKMGPWETSKIRNRNTSQTFPGSLVSDLLFSILLIPWRLASSASWFLWQLEHVQHTGPVIQVKSYVLFLIPGGALINPTWVSCPTLIQSIMVEDWGDGSVTARGSLPARDSLLWMRRELRVSTWTGEILPKMIHSPHLSG